MPDDLRHELSDYFREMDEEFKAKLALARESGDKKAEAKMDAEPPTEG